MGRKYWRISEVARELDVHPKTIRRWLDRGLIPYVRLPSGERRVRTDRVELLLDGVEGLDR